MRVKKLPRKPPLMKVQYNSNLTPEFNQEEKKDFPKCQYHAYYCKKGWYDSKTDTYLHSCHGFHCPRHGQSYRRQLYHDGKLQLPETSFYTTQVFHLNTNYIEKHITSIKNCLERAIKKCCANAKCFLVPHFRWNDDHIHVLIAHDQPLDKKVIEDSLAHGRSILKKLCPEGKLKEWRAEYRPDQWLWYVLRCDESFKPVSYRPTARRVKCYFGWKKLKRCKTVPKLPVSLVDELYQNDTVASFNSGLSINNHLLGGDTYGSLGMGETANQVGWKNQLVSSERLTITPRGFLEDHLFDTS